MQEEAARDTKRTQSSRPASVARDQWQQSVNVESNSHDKMGEEEKEGLIYAPVEHGRDKEQEVESSNSESDRDINEQKPRLSDFRSTGHSDGSNIRSSQQGLQYNDDHSLVHWESSAAADSKGEDVTSQTYSAASRTETSWNLLSDMEKQFRSTPEGMPRRIFILGTGSVGKLVAHSLRLLPKPPPVTLMFHRARLLQSWEQSSKELVVNRDGVDITASGFDVELVSEARKSHGVAMNFRDEMVFRNQDTKPHETATYLAGESPDLTTFRPDLRKGSRYVQQSADHIANLIVTTKTYQTVSSILPIAHRINAFSTICLIQNGMGVIEELNSKLFPDPKRRPHYIQGVISHGVNVPVAIAAHNPFYVVHAGQGTMALGLIQNTEAPRHINNPRYLLRTLTRSPVLVAVGHPPTELLQLQLEKLAVNSIINPLTVMLDARNGSILYNYALTRTMRLMLAETSLVIRSLPELRGLPNVAHRFSSSRLEAYVVQLAKTTAQNVSSMLADVRAGRQTESEYINGYIIKRGEELGIKCVVNYSIMNLVHGKSRMTQQEVRAQPVSSTTVDLNQGL